MKQHQSTGYFFAFGASLALAASFVFSKSVLNHLTMVQFGFIWFTMGVIPSGLQLAGGALTLVGVWYHMGKTIYSSRIKR